MTIKTVDTFVTVPEDRTVMLQLPPDVTTGPHRIIAIIEEPATVLPEPAKDFVFPVIADAHWPEDMPLRREDLYGDDGR